MDQTSRERQPGSFNLLQLPNELLLQVVQFTHPKDLDNLCLSSKHVFTLAEAIRKRHLNNKKKYRTVVLGDTCTASRHVNDQPAAVVHPAFALRDLLRDRESMFDYCEIIKIGGIAYDGQIKDRARYEQPTLDKARVISLDTIARLDDLMDNESLLNGCDKDSWQLELTHDMYHFSCFFSLISLRNVRILEITRCDGFLEKVFDCSSGVWDRNVDVSRTTLQPLGQLQEIRLYGDDDDARQDLPPLPFLLKTPRLRKIYGNFACTSLYEDELSYPEGCWPMLEEFYFGEESSIATKAIEQLLRGTRTLKKFYYHHYHCGYGLDNESYNPFYYIMLLRKYEVQTLASFTCFRTGSRENYDPDYWYKNLDVPSLQDFKVLTHAAVDCSLFINDNIISDHWDRPLNTGFFKLEDPCKDDPRSVDVPRLVDVLPPSLESLVLHRPREPNELTGLFRDLQHLRSQRLPNLRSVTIRTDRAFEVDPKLKNECRELGVEFEIEIDIKRY
ncbi:MAG: hypothetical protein Q9180_006345 [Flavoplaca navasiana]